MKIFELLDGREKQRQRLFCLVRQNYKNPLTKELICKIVDLAAKHKVNISLKFCVNLLNPLFFTLDGYCIYHLGIKPELAKNWGNQKQFLLDLIDLGLIIKASFEDEESGIPVYVLGKDGVIIEEYISEEKDC